MNSVGLKVLFYYLTGTNFFNEILTNILINIFLTFSHMGVAEEIYMFVLTFVQFLSLHLGGNFKGLD